LILVYCNFWISRRTGGLQKSVFDPIRGKYSVPGTPEITPDYKVREKAFAQTSEEKALIKALQAQSRMPDVSQSVAQEQLKQATNRNIAQLAGRIAASRGPSQALALREGMRAQATAGQELAGQSAVLRAQEYNQALQNQLAKQQVLVQELGAQRTQRQALERLRADVAGVGQQARAQSAIATQNLQAQAAGARAKQMGELVSGLGAAGITAFSDKELKKDINKASIDELASALKAVNFKYKKPNGEDYQEGKVTGILAQDLEKSKLGKELVINSKEGKLVDMKKAVPVAMATLAEVLKRLKKLEKEV